MLEKWHVSIDLFGHHVVFWPTCWSWGWSFGGRALNLGPVEVWRVAEEPSPLGSGS